LNIQHYQLNKKSLGCFTQGLYYSLHQFLLRLRQRFFEHAQAFIHFTNGGRRCKIFLSRLCRDSGMAVTNASDTLISQQRYLPFGGERTNVPSPDSPSTDYG
jgi:hypothetical protein